MQNQNITLTIEQRIAQVVQAQKKADEAYQAIERDFPEAWARLQAIEKIREEADKAKEEIKADLIQAHDNDTYQVEGYNVSVSQTVKLKVLDSELVPADLKKPTEEKWDVDIKKAQERYKVLGEVPAGFSDSSTYRLNWREVKNA